MVPRGPSPIDHAQARRAWVDALVWRMHATAFVVKPQDRP